MDRRELDSRYKLSFQQDACLAIGSAADCVCCVEACPPGVLRKDGVGVWVGEGCLGCGRCVASCPTGALAARGYALADSVQFDDHTMDIECWKVPRHLLGEGAHAVPCLGGLTAASLLELALAAGTSQVLTLVDRGWCASCQAGGSAQLPHGAQLEFVRHALTRLGWPEEQLPQMRLAPLPLASMLDEIPSIAEREALGRRAFFSLFIGKATDVLMKDITPADEAASRIPIRHGDRQFPEQMRLIAVLEKLAAARGVPLPLDLFPLVSISESCANHGVCAGVCPTGALSIHENEAGAGLRFDPKLCLDCGLCESNCPEGALKVGCVSPDGHAAPGLAQLTHFPRQVCAACHSSFFSHSEGLCQRCQKNRNAATDLFGTMFA